MQGAIEMLGFSALFKENVAVANTLQFEAARPRASRSGLFFG